MHSDDIDLQQLNQSASVKYKKLVYYDESGNIQQIVSNKINTSYNFIEVDTSEVIDILLGNKATANFLVQYDQTIQQHILSPKLNNNRILKTNLRFYEVLKKEITHQDLEELCIIRNNTNNTWNFELNNSAKTKVLERNDDLNTFLEFSITEKDDPNQLYRFLKIKLRDLVKTSMVTVDFQYQTEINNKEVSIYTSKYFDTYSFKVI